MRKMIVLMALACGSFSNVYADEEVATVDESIVKGDENPADPSLLFDCGCGKGKGGKPKA